MDSGQEDTRGFAGSPAEPARLPASGSTLVVVNTTNTSTSTSHRMIHRWPRDRQG